MNILDVNKSVKAHKKRRRVGRGESSGWGKTAGRGHKGHGQKSGKSLAKFEGGQMQVFRRIPKRGFNNAEFTQVFVPLNVAEIEKIFNDGDVVEPASIKAKGIAKKVDAVKILGNGEITKKVTVKAHAFSKSAAEKIEKAGGTVEVIK